MQIHPLVKGSYEPLQIHLVYLDNNVKLREQVRAVSEDEWKEIKIPSGLPDPLNTTKIASGICHDVGFNEAHHWIYYSRCVKSRRAVSKPESGIA